MPVTRIQLNADSIAKLQEMLPIIAVEFASKPYIINGDWINHSVQGNIPTGQFALYNLPEKLNTHLGIDVTTDKVRDPNGAVTFYYELFKRWQNK